MKCDFCGTIGISHGGIFSCKDDLVSRLKQMKPKLQKAEDILYWVVVSGMMDSFVADYNLEKSDLQKIEELKKFTGFDDN